LRAILNPYSGSLSIQCLNRFSTSLPW